MLLVMAMQGQPDSLYFDQLTVKFKSFIKTNIDSAKKMARFIENEAQKKGYRKGMGMANNYLGICDLTEGNYSSATNHFKTALTFYDTIKGSKLVCDAYSNLGVSYDYQGQFQESIKYYIKALKVAEAIEDKQVIARVSNNLGTLYYQQNNKNAAMNYFKRSLELREILKDDYGIASCCLNISACLDRKTNLNEANQYLERCITHAQLAGDSALMVDAYISVARNSAAEKNYKKALEYFDRALKINKAFNDMRALAQLYSSIGETRAEMHDFAIAHNYLLTSLSLSKQIGYLEGVKKSTRILVVTSAYLNRPDSSSYYLAQYESAHDSLFSESNSRQIADMQTKYETDKKDSEIKLQEEQLKAKSAENTKQKVMIVASGIALLMALVAVFFIYRSFRQKKQSVVEISAQKKIIEEKNKDITDSINYARRIQEVILPPQENADPLFPQSFILFMPKDVVSGDFYWYSSKNEKKLVAAVDCTGHGVPGALMSMLGNAFLNEIVNSRNILQPSEILSELRHKVKQSLKQTGEVGEARDGMDMALLCFNEDNSKVEYAGAHNPLWIFRSEGNGYLLQEYAADKRPVGYFLGRSLPFTNNIIDLRKGDTLYIFSDGYGDQFGGPKGKKFKTAQLKQLILSIQDKTMPEQKTILERTFQEWKSTYEQIDDVCIIGIRV
jgi:serine phosphatase RsbU (regulator of sigma subunit)/Tfp pilus assembly protein PilF